MTDKQINHDGLTSLRVATAADIDEFKHVINESVLELCKHHYTSEQLTSLLAQYPRRAVYEKWLRDRILVVAEQGAKLVGFAQYYPPDNSIEAVHVLPSHARQGVGKQLLTLIEDLAKEQGARHITLGASLNAVEFYEKCGYTRKENDIFKCLDGVELTVIQFEKDLHD